MYTSKFNTDKEMEELIEGAYNNAELSKNTKKASIMLDKIRDTLLKIEGHLDKSAPTRFVRVSNPVNSYGIPQNYIMLYVSVGSVLYQISILTPLTKMEHMNIDIIQYKNDSSKVITSLDELFSEFKQTVLINKTIRDTVEKVEGKFNDLTE